MKQAVKEGAKRSGIMTINKGIAADVEKLYQKYVNDALAQGVDLDTLSPDQLKMIVAMNQPKPPKIYSGQAAVDQLNKLFPKKGEVVEFPQKRSFKEQIDAMRKSGDIVDADDIKISEKITDREMFKNSKLNKPTVEGQMDKINAASNRIKQIQKEQADMYKPKTDAEIKAKYDKQNKESVERLKKKKRDSMPIRLMKNFEKELNEADLMAEGYSKDQANVLIKARKKMTSGEEMSPNESLLRVKEEFADNAGVDVEDFTDIDFEIDIPDYAKGGRAGFYTGGITDIEPNLSDIGHGSDAMMSRTRLMSPGSQATTSTGLNYLLAEDNDNMRIPFKGGGLTPEDYLKVKDMLDHWHDYKKGGGTMSKSSFANSFFRENNAEGGRIGLAGGGGRRAFLKFLASIGGGIAGVKSGMIGLGEGGAKKAITETVKQTAPEGVPPYFINLVKKIKTLGDDVTQTQSLAERQKVTKYKDYELTEDVATGRQEITKYKIDDDLVYDGSEYYGKPLTEETYMSYTPGEEIFQKTAKGKTKIIKSSPEYEEGRALLRSDKGNKGEIVEEIEGVSDDVIKEGTMFEDTIAEFGKADGGRIGYVGGGLSKLGITGSSRKFLEKVFGKQKFQNLIENDPEMHRGLLEVAEMFRSKDKSGLVEYMQNFLPQMSKKELEAFVVGSGDTAGIEGQLIRLGSGRDYKNKLDMIEEANNIRKLKDFDVEDVSKNAEGGRIEMKGGGDALKALIRYYANKKGVKGSTFLKDINPKTLPEGIENILGPEQLKALQINQTDYVQSLLNIMKSDKNFLNNLTANTEEAIAQAPIGMKDFAKEITESIKRDAMKGSRFDRFKVYDKIDIDDAIVDVEQMIKNRRIKESDGRALNSSGGLQTMLGE
jgi:hypothetical protein